MQLMSMPSSLTHYLKASMKKKMGKINVFFVLSWPELKFLINLRTYYSLSTSFLIPPSREAL